MNTEPIQAGDLVIVVRSYCECGLNRQLGHIFRVVQVVEHNNYCYQCHQTMREWTAETGEITFGMHDNFPLYALKRIPPLDELVGAEADEELAA